MLILLLRCALQYEGGGGARETRCTWFIFKSLRETFSERMSSTKRRQDHNGGITTGHIRGARGRANCGHCGGVVVAGRGLRWARSEAPPPAPAQVYSCGSEGGRQFIPALAVAQSVSSCLECESRIPVTTSESDSARSLHSLEFVSCRDRDGRRWCCVPADGARLH